MSAEKIPPKRPLASTSDAAERLATIVDAAERAAASVIDDAEEQARRHLEEARERADRMVAQRLRELADELDPGGPAGPAPEDGAPPRLKPVGDAAPAEGGNGEAPAAPRAGSAGARLLATQMAVSGAEREEIEARLRSGFDVEDADEILDAILGPEE